MHPTTIILLTTTASLTTALAGGARFDELTYGVCQSICTRQALTCYDGAGVAVGSKNTYGPGSAANVTACNMALDTCARACVLVASGWCDAGKFCCPMLSMPMCLVYKKMRTRIDCAGTNPGITV